MGHNGDGECSIPAPAGRAYTAVAAGDSHTVLLLSASATTSAQTDGRAVACGSRAYGKCAVPRGIDPRTDCEYTYTAVAVCEHTKHRNRLWKNNEE